MVVASRPFTRPLPRSLHPGAWWLWALGLATAASRTTNPLLLLLIVAVACLVVAAKRPDAVWALGFRFYLYLGGVIVVLRVVFRVLFGGGTGGHILLHLPQIPLPGWAAGITLLGPVSAESVLGGLYDGLRLATMLICLGAANSLANPKRLLKSVPSALYELGTAVVVALSVAPQLIESVIRVRRARRLRAGPQRGAGALRGILIPVLEDALDRSRALAAAMDSRGYGSTDGLSRGSRRLTGALVLGGLLGVCVGVYGLLDGSTSRYLGAPMLAGRSRPGRAGPARQRAAHPAYAVSTRPLARGRAGRGRQRRDRLCHRLLRQRGRCRQPGAVALSADLAGAADRRRPRRPGGGPAGRGRAAPAAEVPVPAAHPVTAPEPLAVGGRP